MKCVCVTCTDAAMDGAVLCLFCVRVCAAFDHGVWYESRFERAAARLLTWKCHVSRAWLHEFGVQDSEITRSNVHDPRALACMVHDRQDNLLTECTELDARFRAVCAL